MDVLLATSEAPQDLRVGYEYERCISYGEDQWDTSESLVVVTKLVHINLSKWHELVTRGDTQLSEVSMHLGFYMLFSYVMSHSMNLKLLPGYQATQEEVEKGKMVSVCLLRSFKKTDLETQWTILTNPNNGITHLPKPYGDTKTFLSISEEKKKGSRTAALKLAKHDLPYPVIRYVLYLAQFPNPATNKYFSSSSFIL